MNKTKRLANIDLLRILSIFLIVLHHYAIHGGWQIQPGVTELRTVTQMLGLGGKVGVDIYVMITGYLMINKVFKLSNLVKIVVHTTIISVLMYAVMMYTNWVPAYELNGTNIVKNLFPILFNRYWFITAYFLLYVTIPILNPYLQNLTQKRYEFTIFWTFVIVSVWPMVYFESGMTYTRIAFFALLYMIGGYIKKFLGTKEQIQQAKITVGKLTAALFGLLGLALASQLYLSYLPTVKEGIAYKVFVKLFDWSSGTWIYANQSPLLVVFAVVIFCLFLHLNLRSNGFISYVGEATLSVYLFQSSQGFAGFLWKVVDAKQYDQPLVIVAYGIVITVIIFMFGILVHSAVKPFVSVITNKISGVMARMSMFRLPS